MPFDLGLNCLKKNNMNSLQRLKGTFTCCFAIADVADLSDRGYVYSYCLSWRGDIGQEMDCALVKLVKTPSDVCH